MDFKALKEELQQFLEFDRDAFNQEPGYYDKKFGYDKESDVTFPKTERFYLEVNGEKLPEETLLITNNGFIQYNYKHIGRIQNWDAKSPKDKYKELLNILFEKLQTQTGNLPFDSIEDEYGILLYQDGQRYY